MGHKIALERRPWGIIKSPVNNPPKYVPLIFGYQSPSVFSSISAKTAQRPGMNVAVKAPLVARECTQCGVSPRGESLQKMALALLWGF